MGEPRSDCVVVELMHHGMPNWKYWHLAAALGLEHWTVFAGLGRIVVSEIEAPNLFVNLV
jgi:hypothetical protein